MQDTLLSFDLMPASRLDGIAPSEIAQISERAARMRANGRDIAAVACVLEARPDVTVLADEIDRELCYVPFVTFTDAAPALRDRTLIVDGVSKAFSMTGWRIGWGIGPAALISALIKVQGQVTSGACSVAQTAALAAVTGDQSLLDTRRVLFRARRETLLMGLNAIAGLRCALPDGAFYAVPSGAGFLTDAGGPFADDTALCAWLLDTAGVAIVPGRAFELPGYLRLSFAYSDADLCSALARIADALERKIP